MQRPSWAVRSHMIEVARCTNGHRMEIASIPYREDFDPGPNLVRFVEDKDHQSIELWCHEMFEHDSCDADVDRNSIKLVEMFEDRGGAVFEIEES